jgi:hypothetical protein
MAYDPNFPPTGVGLISADWRLQFQGLKALIDALEPIGVIKHWDKNRPGTPALSDSWMECNGQVVTDAASPYVGQNLQDLNGAQGGVPVFLRGANTSVGTGGAENHSHGLPLNINGGSVTAGADVTVFPPGAYTSDPASSFPPYVDTVLIIKIK